MSESCAPNPPEIGSKKETDRKASRSPITEQFSTQTLAEEQTLDELLSKLNLRWLIEEFLSNSIRTNECAYFRHVPKFSPNFPDVDVGESDEDCAMTTDERKEERVEKHGEKVRAMHCQ